jgi:hypothetical protein
VTKVCLLGPLTHKKGLRYSVDDGPRAEKKVLFDLMVLMFPAYSQVRVIPSGIREGVSKGSGRAPSLGSSFAEERRRRSQEAWPRGAIYMCNDIGDLTRSLGRSGDLVGMFKAEWGEKGYLEVKSRRGRDGGGHGEK